MAKTKKVTQEEIYAIAERMQDFAIEVSDMARALERTSGLDMNLAGASAKINQLTRACAELNHWALYKSMMVADMAELRSRLSDRDGKKE